MSLGALRSTGESGDSHKVVARSHYLTTARYSQFKSVTLNGEAEPMEKRALLRLARCASGVALSLCVGCAATAYQRANSAAYDGTADSSGYREVVLDSHTYLVSFNANLFTDRDTVVRSLQFRCAELTIASGYDHFLVLPSSAVARAREDRYAEKTIRLYRGEAPEGSFDAREVMQVIGPLIRRPSIPAPQPPPTDE